MIHLLYGHDEFSIQEALSSMKRDAGPADLFDVNITVFDGDDVSLDLLVATCDTVPFLAEKRLVIVQGLLSRFERRGPMQGRPGRTAEQPPPLGPWKGLAEHFSGMPDTTDLIFVEGPLTDSNPLFRAVRPHVTASRFRLPSPGELRQWIRRRAVDRGIDVEPRAIDTLARVIGSDLRTIAMELQKLSLYHPGQPISHDDVEALVSYAREASIFRMVDAVVEGSADVAIRLAHQILQAGRSSGYLLSMMARQVRLLMLAKELRAESVPAAEHGRRLGLSGYPLRKTLEQQERFSTQRLVEIHRMLLDADATIKSTSVSEDLVMDLLIAQVASAPTGGLVRPAHYRRRGGSA